MILRTVRESQVAAYESVGWKHDGRFYWQQSIMEYVALIEWAGEGDPVEP